MYCNWHLRLGFLGKREVVSHGEFRCVCFMTTWWRRLCYGVDVDVVGKRDIDG